MRAAAAALLCALALLFAEPALAQQQLVGNVNQSNAASNPDRAFNNTHFAQAFTTGPHPGGYWLESVGLLMQTLAQGTDAAAANPTVTIRAESATGTAQGTALTGPTGLPKPSERATVERTFTPSAPLLLHPETTYWIRAEANNPSLRWISTEATAEDGGAPLWSIADKFQQRVGAATAYSDFGSQRALKVRVHGRERRDNVPATGGPVILGAAVARQTLSADLTGIDDPNGLLNATGLVYEWRTTKGPSLGNNVNATTARLTDAHVGAKIHLVIGFRDDDGHYEEFRTAEYPANGTVRAHNHGIADRPPTGAVVIEGASLSGGTVPATGDLLRANTDGLADPDGLNRHAFTHTWLRRPPSGPEVVAHVISGVEPGGYRVGDDDVGSQLRVRVTAVDEFGGRATVESAPTEAVADWAMACAQPDRTGRRVVWQNTVRPEWITSGAPTARKPGDSATRRDLGYDGSQPGAGSLSSGWVKFRAGLSQEYTLDGAWLRNGDDLHLALESKHGSDVDRGKLRFHVCGHTFSLTPTDYETLVVIGEGDAATRRVIYRWNDTGLDWTLEDGFAEGGTPFQQTLWLTVPDAPVLQSASANGRTVTLAFDRDRRLAPNNFPLDPAAAFTLALEGGTAPNVESGTVDGNLVILNLDTPVNADGSGAYTISYTRPESSLGGTLRDTDGIEVESFSGKLVRNRTRSNETVLPAGSERVLLSNINLEGRTIGGIALAARFDMAQGFTTGGHPGGYDLTGIVLGLGNTSGSTHLPTVRLFSGSASGKEVAAFHGPAAAPPAESPIEVLFTPSAPVALAPATRYWVVVEDKPGQLFDWNFVGITDSDAPPAPGWRRSGGYGLRAHDSTGAFTFESGLYAQMALHGAPRAFATGGGAAAGQPDGIRAEAVDGGVRVHWRPPRWHRHATSHLLYDLRYRIGAGPWIDGPQGIRGEFLGDPQDGTRWAALPGVADVADLEVQVTARSSDATLSGIALEDDSGNPVALSPGFSAQTESYKARVQFADEVTIAPTASDDGATMEILDGSGRTLADADPNKAGHQVTLNRLADTNVRIRVTSESTNARTYAVTVRRVPDHCDLADPNELWCGLVTAGSGRRSGDTHLGYGYSADDSIGGLWPREFDYRTATIALDTFWLKTDNRLHWGFERTAGTTPADGLLGTGAFIFDWWNAGGDRESMVFLNPGMDEAFSDGADVPSFRGRTIPVKLFRIPDGALLDLDVQDADATMEVAELSPAFHWATEAYTASVRHAEDEIVFGVASASNSDTVEFLDGDGMAIDDDDNNKFGHQIALAVGENTIWIKVTATGGATRTYTVVVTRAAATSDATLANLAVYDQAGGQLLDPTFSPTHETYTAWARNSMEHVNVLPTPNDDSAVVEYLDADNMAIVDASDTADGHQAALSVGTNTIKVKVTASDTVTEKTYTVTVTRAAADADASLTSLRFANAADDAGIRLDGVGFGWANRNYTASVANGVDEITVTPGTSQSDATVAYLDGSDSAIADADSMKDGHQVALSEGANTIQVKVTAGNGTTTRTYTLVVTRLAPTLVSNQLQVRSGRIDVFGMAQAFTTGAHSSGYGLDSIVLDGEFLSNDGVTVALHQGSRTGPKVAAFGGTIPFGRNFTLTPTTEVTLSASTTYVIVMSNDLATGNNWNTTNADAEDATPAAGWTIADGSEVRATSGDAWETRTDAFKISVNGRPVVSSDATLRLLSLTDENDAAVTLSPTFASATEEYTATVAADIAEITVSPTTSDTAGTVEYLDGGDSAIDDADDMEDGQQVALDYGTNLIKIKVTASDMTSEKTYTVKVVRGAPELVSNGDQTVDDNSDAGQKAQAFSTGAHADGYLLQEIVLYGNFFAGAGQTVALHQDSRTGMKAADFTGTIDDDKNLLLTPTADVTLSASTTYVVVTANDFAAGNEWFTTASDSEDAVSATGWGIADGLQFYQTTSTSWQDGASSFLLTVYGTEAKSGGGGRGTGTGKGSKTTPKTQQDGTEKQGGLRGPGETGVPDPGTPAITSAAQFQVPENTTAITTLTATDANTPAADLTWTLNGGADQSAFSLTEAGVLTFTQAKDFESPDDDGADGSYQVSVQVSDGDIDATADLTVTLTDVNEAPTANAGADQTGIPGATPVTLAGTGTDPDAGDTLTFAWAKTAGPAITLAGAGTATATFTAPAGLTLDTAFTFELTVTDAAGLTHTDTVSVTVARGAALTATFQNVQETHDGAASFDAQLHFSEEVDLSFEAFTAGLFEINGGTVGKAKRLAPPSNIGWVFPVTPSGDADVVITLPAGRACDRMSGPCTSDGRRLSQAVSVTVAGPAPTAAPVITSASGFTVAENATDVATLTATDEDTAAADLVWSIPAGADGGADGSKFSITAAGALGFRTAQDFEDPDDADSDGAYQVTVQVSDGENTATADLTVSLSNENEAPEADAGEDQDNVAEGAEVTLTGTGTDPDAGDTLTYAWTRKSGPAVNLTGADTATATFAAPTGLTEDAEFTFELTVTDAAGLTHADTVSVTVMPDVPVATISADTGPVTEGSPATFTVTLDKGAPAALSVAVTVTESADMLAANPPASVSFAEGESSKTLSVPTDDDKVIESGGTVTVTLGTGTDYSLGSATSATLDMEDNDTASFTVSASRDEIAEGQSTRITVAISNGTTFAANQSIALSATGTAASSDYTLHPLTLGLTAGETSTDSQLDALADDLDESDETVTVSATHGGDAVGSVTVTIAQPPDAAWGERQSDSDIDLDSDANPTGAWSDGSDVWVISDWEEGEVKVYDLSDGTEDTTRRLTLSGLGFPTALWSNGTTLWVADFNGGVKAFSLANGNARTAEDFDSDVMSAAGNAMPSGLWSNGDTMWIADYTALKAFAYSLSDKSRLPARDIALEKSPGETYFPFGLWSNGTTLLASDWGGGELVGYALSGGARAADRDIDASAAGIGSPAGMVSDGSTLWVVDDTGKRLAAFAVP